MGKKQVKLSKLEKHILQELMNERWLYIKIDGNETNYQISNTGKVISMYGKLLKSTFNTNNYLQVRIWYNRKGYMRKVHRLVAEAFIPNPENKPEVNHINGIKTDNRVENLEWVDRQENMNHAYENNLIPILYGEKSGNAKYTDKQIHEVCRLLEKGLMSKIISKLTGVGKNTINQIRCKQTWTHISKDYNIKTYKRRQFPKEMEQKVINTHIKYPLLSYSKLTKIVIQETGYNISTPTVGQYIKKYKTK